MKIRSVGAVCFAFFLAIGAAACGDSDTPGDSGSGSASGSTSDATSSSGGTVAGDDATGTTNESDGAASEADEADDATGSDPADDDTSTTGPEEDVEPAPQVDPCDPNPCTVAPPATCSEDKASVTTFAAEGTCTVIDDEASCAHEETVTACEGDDFCAGGACVAPGTPEDYVFDANASVITKLGLAEDDATTPDVDEGDCCFDFDGDGAADNGLGGLIGSLGAFLGDSLGDGGVNGLIQEQLDSGDLTILFEQVDLTDAMNDDMVWLNGFFGEKNEDGTYAVDPASFIEGTSAPYISFNNGVIEEGVITAGPSLFSVTIPLGDFGIELALDAQQTQIRSNVAMGADGVGLDWTDGILGGVVPMQQLVDALNGLGATCDCLGLGGGDMLELAAEDKLGCTQALKDATPACTEDNDGSLCAGLGENKGLVCTAIGIIKPDIDTDWSGKKDSFSLGLRFEGVPATISGLAAAAEETTE